jgi:DNA-binding MarR family transcriptional regulator
MHNSDIDYYRARIAEGEQHAAVTLPREVRLAHAPTAVLDTPDLATAVGNLCEKEVFDAASATRLTSASPAPIACVSTTRLAAAARRLLKEADARLQYFPWLVSHEPVWLILLDLYVQTAKGRRVSVSDACLAARVPKTTALRSIGELVQHGAVVRTPDPKDRRRTHLEMTAQSFASMSQYLARSLSHQPGGAPSHRP